MSSTYELLHGYATSAGTKKYVEYAIQRGKPSSHFRIFDALYLSSIGMGTYLGQLTAEDDKAMENAVYESIKSGAVNVIDTAINYRAMKSEKSVGRALLRLEKEGIISRDEVFICTKNGYITNDGDYPSIDVMEYMQKMFISTDIINAHDISSGYNVLNPNYIERCIEKSLMNMHIETIDLVYIHNSFESWHEDVSREEFMQMLAKVFEVYEKYRSNTKIRYYGMATWTCFRVSQDNKEYLSLEQVVKLAENIGGRQHGFRFIQLPYNLAYSEALLLKNQIVGSERNLTILEAANRLNIKVFTSIPLFQSRLLRAQIPDYIGLTDQVAKLVQVIRSSPSVIAPLIGHKKPEHVEQNLMVANIPPLNDIEFKKAIQVLLKGNS
ncbi:MAG: aldo/keto reductase [Nitrososphaeraceae archaeon]|nr:aldo/keto reductase [Nitrososphaeraceae archaeon]MBV9666794.1 aldo/keto reductase [Nitrososphaeraceae archaeon]